MSNWKREINVWRANGLACGTIAMLAVIVTTLVLDSPAHGQTYTESVIYSFAGGTAGIEPLFSGVVRDSTGNLYGTTISGGTHNRGTVFKVDQNGVETVLHSFTGPDGDTPYAGLVLGPGGLYGTTYEGGIFNSMYSKGCGVVFKVDLNGNTTVLHRFKGGADGALPFGGLILDAAGNLYGTTEAGGAAGSGTIFKVDNTGLESLLYSFAGQPDGQDPEAGLIQDSAGNFYGTTAGGGTHGLGAVFELEASGHEAVLYSFAGGSDGSAPRAAVLRASNGDLYGTTFTGGPDDVGTVFEVKANGQETVLQGFYGTGGAYPDAPLANDSQGNLYGSTIQGGPGGIYGGMVFEINTQGAFSVVYNFAGEPDGGGPAGPLMVDSQGNIYGTTASGGTSNNGTVFELSR